MSRMDRIKHNNVNNHIKYKWFKDHNKSKCWSNWLKMQEPTICSYKNTTLNTKTQKTK